MTIEMISCEQCALKVATTEVMYSASGQQVCRACHAKSEETAAAARVAASQRVASRTLLVAALLVLGFAGAMFAMGDGPLVGVAVSVLGSMMIVSRRFMRNPQKQPGYFAISSGQGALLYFTGIAILVLGGVIVSMSPRGCV